MMMRCHQTALPGSRLSSPAPRLAPTTSSSCRPTPQPCSADRTIAACSPSTSGRPRQPSSCGLAAPSLLRASHRYVRASSSSTGEAEAAPSAAAQGGEATFSLSTSVSSTVQFALNLARVSETYEVHSWMLLLGILKQERCTASAVLKDLGLTDLYAAWNEVMWALNVSDGLKPKAWKAEVLFCKRAYVILRASDDFAKWGGRRQTQTQDVLMAAAAAGVLEGLFPDVDLSFDAVRQAVERVTDSAYVLPDDEEAGRAGGLEKQAAAELVV